MILGDKSFLTLPVLLGGRVGNLPLEAIDCVVTNAGKVPLIERAQVTQGQLRTAYDSLHRLDDRSSAEVQRAKSHYLELFRIKKSLLEETDDKSVNAYLSEQLGFTKIVGQDPALSRLQETYAKLSRTAREGLYILLVEEKVHVENLKRFLLSPCLNQRQRHPT